jgi:anion-transporting  ArsA/GET3 family ATPase
LQTIELLQNNVSDKFDEEKRSLKNLRVRSYEVETFTDILSVSKYGTVRINKAVYSVPDGYVESLVRVVITSTEIQIFNMHNAQLIASHPRLKDQQQSIKLEHVVSSLVQKPGALIHWKHRSIIFEDKILLQFYEKLKKQDHYNAEKQLLQVLNLIQHTTLNEIKASIELWLENPNESVFNFVRYLTLEERRPTQNIEQEKIKPNLNEYDKILKGEHLNAYPH